MVDVAAPDRGRGRHSGGAKRLRGLDRRLFGCPRFDHRLQLGAVFPTLEPGAKTRVLAEMIETAVFAERVPVFVRTAGDRDPAAPRALVAVGVGLRRTHRGAAEHIVRCIRPVTIADAVAIAAKQVNVQELFRDVHADRLGGRRIDELSSPCPGVVVESGEHRHGGGSAGAQINRAAHHHGRLLRLAREIGEPAERGKGGGIAGVVALRAGRAQSRSGDHHNLRIDFAQIVIAEPELLENARPEVVDRAVGGAGEIADDLLRAFRFQIELDRVLVEVDLIEHWRLVDAARERTHRQRSLTRVIDPGRRLNLDQLRTQQRQLHGAVRSSPGPGEVDDPLARKWPRSIGRLQ